jgi:tetratricopeptide (TPR) repeat protein
MEPLFKNFQGRFTNGGVFLMYRKIFQAIGGFDSELKSGQHTEMSYRLIPYLIENQLKIANIMEPLIKVHVHDGPRIRYNANAIFEGSTRTLLKHGELFKKDRQRYINYLSVAGVSGVRTKRYEEAKRYFQKALEQNPYRVRYWFRWMISCIPGLRDKVWRNQSKFS